MSIKKQDKTKESVKVEIGNPSEKEFRGRLQRQPEN